MNNIDLAIEDFVNKTLNLEGLTLKGFEKLAISNGFYFKQQGGDENHGTYAILKLTTLILQRLPNVIAVIFTD